METVKLSDGIERLIINPEKDKCPICETDMKDVHFRWQIFHGEGESSCCHTLYQLKSWYVDPDKNKQDIIDFSNSLNKPDRIYMKIDNEWIEPIKEALNKTGSKYINDCLDLALEIKNKSTE